MKKDRKYTIKKNIIEFMNEKVEKIYHQEIK